MMRIKICGITKPEQGQAIAQAGATALGFICVRQSPRYVSVEQIRTIVEALPLDPLTAQLVDRIGVFVNASVEEIERVVAIAGLSGVQLHGQESPEFCRQLRNRLGTVELIRAFRIRTPEDLHQSQHYQDWVDTFLLDAYHPTLWGGTGKTLDWSSLQTFRPQRPWLLAGGLTPDNVLEALNQVTPDGIDLSSGVERAPGDKDLDQVIRLFTALNKL